MQTQQRKPSQILSRSIGAHVSAAGGADQAIARAHAIGANAVQIFSGSPRVWKRSPLESLNSDKVYSEKEKYSIRSIFIHSIYLINLAAESTELHTKSCEVIAYDLEYGSRISAGGVVVHLGSHQGRGWESVREQVAADLRTLLQDASENAVLLIENSAGQNGKLCSDLSDIRWLLDAVDSPKLGWCLDTCHAFAGGHYLGESAPQDTPAKDHIVVKSLEQEITQNNLWDSLKCIHVNDSKDPFASGRDRHENLGDGSIPTADLRRFLKLSQVENIPLILEVPGIEGGGPDAENIARLQKLAE
jgi:deoxyribonuclease IV